MRIASIATGVLMSVLAACSYTATDTKEVKGSEVGGTGNIRYTHENLTGTRHLLSITAAPGLMETEGSIAQRIFIFANRFAAQICPKDFRFVDDPNFDQAIAAGFMKRTKTYVFQCN